MISSAQALRVVQDWHTALNNRNKDLLSTLVHKDVAVSGPKGVTAGVDILLEWVDRANVRLHPQRYFLNEETVGVEELGQWHDAQTGAITGSQVVVSVFSVKDGLIASIDRYSDLKQALTASGLSEVDKIL